MVWDIALDSGSGDLVFDAKYDLLGVNGSELVNQRILTRCKIPRGTFKMDDSGTLGSTLHLISAKGGVDQDDEIEAATQEALEPMEDIEIEEIVVDIIENTTRLIHVHWRNASAEGEPVEEAVEVTPTYDATVTY